MTTGQRKYGGPPPGWQGASPGNGCEVGQVGGLVEDLGVESNRRKGVKVGEYGIFC